MELSHKTTILLSEPLHQRLSDLARERKTSMGELVRRACQAQYGTGDNAARVQAVQALAALSLPVAEPAQLKRESLQAYKDLADADPAAH